jgi:ABC-type bacteriocin/lantibiotic exporter with double-glycine peptidase domain
MGLLHGQTCSTTRQILWLVGAALRAHCSVGRLIFGGLLIEMTFSAAVPMSFKYLVDYAIVPHDEKILFAILAGLALSLVVASAAGLGLDYLYAKFATGVLNDLRLRPVARCFAKAIRAINFTSSRVAD